MLRKKRIIKKASKDAEWAVRLDERTTNIIDAVREVKDHSVKFEEKVETRFKDLHTNLEKCINDKFNRHNDYHVKLEKRYTRIFIGLAALTIGGLAANPSSVVYIASKVVLVLKFLVGML